MKKISLKKLALLIAIVICYGEVMHAQNDPETIAITNINTWNTGEDLDGKEYSSSTKADLIVSFSKGDGESSPTFGVVSDTNTSKCAILSIGNTMTITTHSNIITKVAFQFGTGSSTAKGDNSEFTPTGTYTNSASNEKTKNVWEGATQKLVLKNLNNKGAIKIMRVYVYYEAAPTVASTADSYGFYKVGACTITNVNKFIFEQNMLPALDLTDVKLDEGVSSLNLANPNTIFQVEGTAENSNATPTDSKWNNLNVNLIVKRTDNVFVAATPIQFTDKNDCPVLTQKHFLVSKGCTYKRTMKANAWATSMLPAAISNLPFDAYIVDTDNSSANQVAFKKVTDVPAYTPFLIHNTSNSETEWSVDLGNGTCDLRTTTQHNATAIVSTPDATFTGTFNTLSCEGKEYYALYNSTSTGNELTLKKFGKLGIIGAFRAYFTLNNSQTNASKISFSFDSNDVTDIAPLEEVLGIHQPANVYNLNGQIVKANVTSLEGLTKGIYLFHGKKYVVK